VNTSDGKHQRTHVFRIVLSTSRKAYSEVVYRQTAEEFIRCLENAFHHFGGVPKTMVPDNPNTVGAHPLFRARHFMATSCSSGHLTYSYIGI